jgi:hypothetical protein
MRAEALAGRGIVGQPGDRPGLRAQQHPRPGGISSGEAYKVGFDDPYVTAVPASPKPAKRGQGIVWAESQPQWPDGTRRRSVVIDVKADLLKGLEKFLPARPMR